MPKSRLYDWIAAAIAGVLAVVELVRIGILRGGTAGHNETSTLIGGLIFSAVLAAAAVGFALHKRLGWLLGVFAFLAATAHGVIVRLGANPIGFVYIAGAVALFAVLAKDLQMVGRSTPNDA